MVRNVGKITIEQKILKSKIRLPVKMAMEVLINAVFTFFHNHTKITTKLRNNHH